MPKYQNYNFDKQAYQVKKSCALKPEQRRLLHWLRRHEHESAPHGLTQPEPITKKALLKPTRARRQLLGDVCGVVLV